MSREKIHFPTADAYYPGLALLEDTAPGFLWNEKKRMVAAGKIPSHLRSGLAVLGASVTVDDRYGAENDKGV